MTISLDYQIIDSIKSTWYVILIVIVIMLILIFYIFPKVSQNSTNKNTFKQPFKDKQATNTQQREDV